MFFILCPGIALLLLKVFCFVYFLFVGFVNLTQARALVLNRPGAETLSYIYVMVTPSYKIIFAPTS